MKPSVELVAVFSLKQKETERFYLWIFMRTNLSNNFRVLHHIFVERYWTNSNICSQQSHGHHGRQRKNRSDIYLRFVLPTIIASIKWHGFFVYTCYMKSSLWLHRLRLHDTEYKEPQNHAHRWFGAKSIKDAIVKPFSTTTFGGKVLPIEA